MIINEWTVNPYLWTVVMAVLLLMIIIPISIYFKGHSISKINIGIGLLVFAVLVSSLSTKEKHIYYNYKTYSEVEQLESDGWDIVRVYDNKKIIHAKRER